jgi:hypothetical protein
MIKKIYRLISDGNPARIIVDELPVQGFSDVLGAS